MTEYRIVGNGVDYKIQELGYTFWRKRPIWKYCSYWEQENIRYDSKKSAQYRIDIWLANEAARERGYTPITKQQRGFLCYAGDTGLSRNRVSV